MRTDDDADETLMLRYRDGDAGAFEHLYARHKGSLYRYLLRQCGQPAVAEELFQDIWLKLIAARGGYAVQAKFSTWLYRIAHNRLVDHYRASARGLDFDAAALDWMLRRCSRDLGTLTALFERLDRASLAAQRRLTVPFLRQVLGAEGADSVVP